MKAKIKISLSCSLMVMIIFCLTNCKDDETGVDVPASQQILFERYYINQAWIYQHSGFLIDRNGQIHTYSEPWFYSFQSNWIFPDNKGFIAQDSVLKNLEKTKISGKRIDINELNKYARKIALVREDDYSDQSHGAADMGEVVSVCYLYDEKTKTYKQIILSEYGDLIRINTNSAAKAIDEWLKTIEID